MNNVDLKTSPATVRQCLIVKCLDCMCGDTVAIVECDSPDCPLVTVRPRSRPDAMRKKFWDEETGRLRLLPKARKRGEK